MTMFTLKIIAVLAMIIDHIPKALSLQLFLLDNFAIGLDKSYALIHIMDNIGRIAFPIFAFGIAEGCRKTRNIKKYIGRLLLFGLIAEVPYRLAVDHYYGFLPTFHNIFFTLALGAIAIWGYEYIKEHYHWRWVRWCPCCFCMMLAFVFETEYFSLGVLLIVAIYYFQQKNAKLLAMLVILSVFYLGYAPSWLLGIRIGDIKTWLWACSAVLLLKCYNGQRGYQSKWFFYWIYPIHLLVLYFIKQLLA